MTVKELIAELNKVEDKDMAVEVYANMHDLTVTSIYENNYDHSIRLNLEHIEIEYDDFL